MLAFGSGADCATVSSLTGAIHLSEAVCRAVASTLAVLTLISRGGMTSRPRWFCGCSWVIAKVSARKRWVASVWSLGVLRSPWNSAETVSSATTALCPLPIGRTALGV